jgi:uncharacterized protein YdeI (YjbR/CyaY-like superfamily)
MANINRTDFSSWIRDGCGRCEHYRTPACKVLKWTEPLTALRESLLAAELNETMKWGSPCYTFGGKNVVMLVALRDRCALSFFKGALLPDPDGLLEKPGPNSRHGRTLSFRTAADVRRSSGAIERFVRSAIEVERRGRVVAPPSPGEPLPDALAERLHADPELAARFEALTPGRQRSHRIHVGGAKTLDARKRRAERCVPKILEGKGYNER